MPFRQVSVSGFPGIALRNPRMELIVVPALGARITNLRRHDGREWLWRHPSLLPVLTAPGDDYARTGDFGGWDECLPTVAACAVPGNPSAPPLPDHGELWTARWDVRVLSHAQGLTLAAATRGTAFPYEFARDLTLDPDEAVVHLRYRLRHLGARPFPFLWAAHPLLAAPAGTTVSLPGVAQVRVAHVHGRTDLARGDILGWPPDGHHDPFVVPAGDAGWALKLFADLGGDGVMRMTDPRAGEVLELAASPGEVPQVGLWVDVRQPAVDGEEAVGVVGLEPCIGAPDSLLEAVEEWHSAALLEPGEERAWGLTLRLPAPETGS